jgi:hypothetical protein
LDLQYAITTTISCHGQPDTRNHPELTQEVNFDKYTLAFRIPENWRTHEYHSEEWFPDGLSETNGTLWTLLTDADKYIDLIWSDVEQEISTHSFQEYTDRFLAEEFTFQGVNYKIDDFIVEGSENKSGMIIGKGTYKRLYIIEYNDQDHLLSDNWIYRAFLWNCGNRTYFLLVSIIAHRTIWGRSIDLNPKDEVIDDSIEKHVLSNIKVFPKS